MKSFLLLFSSEKRRFFLLPTRQTSGAPFSCQTQNLTFSKKIFWISGLACAQIPGDAKPTRRTERSRRTAPLGAGDSARPHSGAVEAPSPGPARRLLDGRSPAPHAARAAPGLALLHQHRFPRRPGLHPGFPRPAPHSPTPGRNRLAHARQAQPGHVPVRPPRARTPPHPGRPRTTMAAARPKSPRIRRQNPASRGDRSWPNQITPGKWHATICPSTPGLN